ncbi:MAG: hypothetical protein LBK71_02805 [Verrucomicrobiales bacterium]|jgi:hypothetical protein|nr:hypothetical protein [Verrucomicrobiales bacterium]
MSTNHQFASYVPTTADARYHWALNLLDYVYNNQATFTSVPKELFDQANARREQLQKLYDALLDVRRLSAAMTAAYREFMEGLPHGNYTNRLTLPKLDTAGASLLTGAATVYLAGLVPWLVKALIPALQADPKWTDDLNVICSLVPPAAGDTLRQHNFQLKVEKSLDGQHLELRLHKGDFTLFQIDRRIDDGKVATFTVSHLPWIDPQPLADKPETREYQVRGLVKDQPYGAPSEKIIVTERRTEHLTVESV